MSVTILAACKPLQMPPTPKAVLMALADSSNDQGYCWPSLTTLCEWTCFGRTAVIEAIKWLESAGYVSASREAAKSNRYQILANAKQNSGPYSHYVYQITHLPTGRYYIGLRSTAALPEQDDYFGSGKCAAWFESVRSECEKNILSVHQTRVEAAQEEQRQIKEVINDPLCQNLRVSSPGQSSGKRTVREADGPSGGFDSPGDGLQQSGRRTEIVREADPNRKEPSRTVNKSNCKTREQVALDFSRWHAQPKPEQLAEWLAHRKRKKAETTQTVIDRMAGKLWDAKNVGYSVDDVLATICDRNWTGFEVGWLEPKGAAKANKPPQIGKQAQALMALEAMKSGNAMAAGSGFGGAATSRLLGFGSNPGGGTFALDADRVD